MNLQSQLLTSQLRYQPTYQPINQPTHQPIRVVVRLPVSSYPANRAASQPNLVWILLRILEMLLLPTQLITADLNSEFQQCIVAQEAIHHPERAELPVGNPLI